jgi:N-methylhydantoinase A/oxoprolinase/acetone carboxylase beta subunit
LRRSDLEKPVAGPAIVEEYDATSVIPPRASGSLDAAGNIVIELR